MGVVQQVHEMAHFAQGLECRPCLRCLVSVSLMMCMMQSDFCSIQTLSYPYQKMLSTYTDFMSNISSRVEAPTLVNSVAVLQVLFY